MSDRRALLFDVGNTRVKWGLLHKGRISRTGSIEHDKIRELGFKPLTSRLPDRIDAALVCNVAGPSFAKRLSSVVGIHCKTDVRFVTPQRSACGVTCGYRQPRRLGADRWVALIGARGVSRSALCVVDAGTALTIDALDNSGRHLGGQIAPGMALMSAALSRQTSDIQLPNATKGPLPKGLGLFANNTRTAVRAGALTAVCGAIERAVKTLRGAGMRPKIVLTGGDASRILSALGDNVLHRPHLVLEGLKIIVQDGT